MTHPSHDADANLNASSGRLAIPGQVRHAVTVRITHWISAVCFLALLVSGVELVISHPRFYWGEEGNVNVPAFFSIPIPASRGSVPTGYGYVLPDQNGWSRSLHFQTAWVVVSTGLIYLGFGFLSGHFRRNLLPAAAELSPRAFVGQVLAHLRLRVQGVDLPYNSLQRISYLGVVFGAFPFMIWTGLAMSPAVTGAFPFLVETLGGHQSARTLHFMDTLLLVLFVIVHVVMISVNGFRGRIRGMTIGERKSES